MKARLRVNQRIMSKRKNKHGLKILFTLLSGLIIAGCGQRQLMSASGNMKYQLRAGNVQGALATVHRAKQSGAYKEQDRVMYWMNEGMLLHMLGKYQASTASLQKAERRSDQLFTKSIRKGIKATFTSEASTDYEGQDYEKVMLNVVKAFNFLCANQIEGALVEARKINEKLVYFNSKYRHKNVYNQDAFAHWLMGMLFEIERSYDDARIAYQKSIEIYERDFSRNYGISPPPYVYEDLMRVARINGDKDLLAQYASKYQSRGATGKSADMLRSHGEIVLFHLNGEGPTKRDYFINCYFRNAVNWFCDARPGGDFLVQNRIRILPGYTTIKIAFPRLMLHPPRVRSLTIRARNNTGVSVTAEPISRIALKVFRDQTGRVFKNAVKRAVVKALTQKAAGMAGKAVGGKKYGSALGLLARLTTSVANQASEEADKRTWTTLPSRIDVARVFATPGVQTLEIQTSNGGFYRFPNVRVQAGKRTFITYWTVP